MVGYVVEFGEAIALNSSLRLKLVLILGASYKWPRLSLEVLSIRLKMKQRCKAAFN